MNFNNVLPYKNNFRNGCSKTNNGKLPLPADPNDEIIALALYIFELCSWGDKLDCLTEPQRFFYLNQSLEWEIGIGGFNQYFYNASGDYAHETLVSLRIVGANRKAGILQQAIDQFPDATVSKDRVERKRTMQHMKDQVYEEWEKFDQQFYSCEEQLNMLNLQYVRQNGCSLEDILKTP